MSLATTPIPTPEVSRKRPQDITPDEEELIEGSGLFVKRLRIPGYPDIRKWILKNKSPASLQNLDVRNHYTESIRFTSDVLRWTEHSKDDLPNAILGHILEVYTLIFSSATIYLQFCIFYIFLF